MKQIKVSEVLALLEEGLKRPEIQSRLELNGKEMKALFQHPSLKHKRAKTSERPVELEIVDDTVEEAVESVTESETPVEVVEAAMQTAEEVANAEVEEARKESESESESESSDSAPSWNN